MQVFKNMTTKVTSKLLRFRSRIKTGIRNLAIPLQAEQSSAVRSGRNISTITNLGINTPLSHIISKAPNGWVPNRYCSGHPRPRLSHSAFNQPLPPPPPPPPSSAPRRPSWASQRSSMDACSIVRHSGRRSGRNACLLLAARISSGVKRGICGGP